MFNTVGTGRVAGIYTGKIGRLYATGSKVTIVQYSVAIRPFYPFTPPGAHCRVTVAQSSFASAKKLISQLEIEIIAHALCEKYKISLLYNIIYEV